MEALRKIGLSDAEATMYTTVLRLGEVPIADVTRVAGEHPQIVYRLIERLAASGHLIVSTRKHRKYVRAEDPKNIARMEEKKIESFRASIPELLSMQCTSDDAIVRIARGAEGVKALRMRGIEELRSGESYYVMGASGEHFYGVMGDYYRKVEALRIKKKIKRLLLTYENQRTLIEKAEKNAPEFRTYAEYRYLPTTVPVLSSTNIFGSTVAILVWTEDPIVITIESASVAESYRQYFQAFWSIAKE